MEWEQIIWALALAALLVFVFPRMRAAMKNSPEGESSDWMAALIPLALVGAFVALLVAMV